MRAIYYRFSPFNLHFTYFTMSNFAVAPVRTSSFIEDIDYNLVDSQVRVQFKNQDVNYYTVTLDAIQELLNPMTSFGFWFNKYCR